LRRDRRGIGVVPAVHPAHRFAAVVLLAVTSRTLLRLDYVSGDHCRNGTRRPREAGGGGGRQHGGGNSESELLDTGHCWFLHAFQYKVEHEEVLTIQGRFSSGLLQPVETAETTERGREFGVNESLPRSISRRILFPFGTDKENGVPASGISTD
jgi:hypothetical protein